jgi:hypothetical protein
LRPGHAQVRCGSSYQIVQTDIAFISSSDINGEAGRVTNDSGIDFGEIDVVAMLQNAFPNNYIKGTSFPTTISG